MKTPPFWVPAGVEGIRQPHKYLTMKEKPGKWIDVAEKTYKKMCRIKSKKRKRKRK